MIDVIGILQELCSGSGLPTMQGSPFCPFVHLDNRVLRHSKQWLGTQGGT
jgi:hypothetical protein